MTGTDRIREITTEDYFFLTENFERLDAEKSAGIISYIVRDRRKKLCDTVKKAFENELSVLEQNIIIDRRDKGISASLVAKKYGMSRSSVYRTVASAEKKLESVLKYVLIYNDSVRPLSVRECLAGIKNNEASGDAIEN